MTSLIRTEWLKMRKYNAFWWVMGVTALAYPGISYIFHFAYKDFIKQPGAAGQVAKLIENPFSFPEVWHTLAYGSSLFIFIPAIVVIMFITNEYTFKTHRQNIIDGWSRSQFITSKLIDILIVTLLIALLYSIMCLVVGFANQTSDKENPWGMSYYAGLFAVQTFSQLSVAFLIGFLIRKAFIALAIFAFYFFPLEVIIVQLLKHYAHDEGRFLPLELSDRMIPSPAFWGKIDPVRYEHALGQVQPHTIYTIIFTTLIWLLCYRIHSRRDLK
jgi:ABC-type transport system involved in multi-copper enzyme maturation permease subunit